MLCGALMKLSEAIRRRRQIDEFNRSITWNFFAIVYASLSCLPPLNFTVGVKLLISLILLKVTK